MEVMLYIIYSYIFKIGASKKIAILMFSVLLTSSISSFIITTKGAQSGASLVIDAPSQIYGGEILQVIVNDSAGYPMGDVLVTISNDTLGVSDYTDMDGTVSFTAPLVEYNAPYIINASKPGFESDQKLITVLVNSLILYMPSEVIEGERFEARVADIIDNPIENAIISCDVFPTYEFQTNREGIAVLTAPNVEEDTTYDLTARKEGYQSGVSKIKVKDNASFPEEQLVIIVTSSAIEEEEFTVTITANTEPDKPYKPSGITVGKPGTYYTYSSHTTDPEGDHVYLVFDWGDGNDSGWVGPFNSGDIGSASYAWSAEGTFPVKVKAKDIHDAESVWSDPLPITMPKNYGNPFYQFLERLFEWIFQQILGIYI